MATIEQLIQKGVTVLSPPSVYIDEHVDINRISGKGVTIYPGCRIYGEKTLISQGAVLGEEGPSTIENCYIGPHVRLKGGFFKSAVFWDHASFGLGGHVREGTILEEHASCAHTVGLKQTILFPYVTLGSLINFCDCLMAGGTGAKNHSEVGSSYIHFNFTPHQDKATPSLMGDVPLGVMMKKAPIFLGGQGGLVGPCRIAYGVIVAAGSVVRRDIKDEDILVMEGNSRSGKLKFVPGCYRSVKRAVQNNLIYMANLIALKAWYAKVRQRFIVDDLSAAFFKGACDTLDSTISERQKRFLIFCNKVSRSYDLYKETLPEQLLKQKVQLRDQCVHIDDQISAFKGKIPAFKEETLFLSQIDHSITQKGKDYVAVIKSLNLKASQSGSLWLQHIVDHITTSLFKLIPLFK